MASFPQRVAAGTYTREGANFLPVSRPGEKPLQFRKSPDQRITLIGVQPHIRAHRWKGDRYMTGPHQLDAGPGRFLVRVDRETGEVEGEGNGRQPVIIRYLPGETRCVPIAAQNPGRQTGTFQPADMANLDPHDGPHRRVADLEYRDLGAPE